MGFLDRLANWLAPSVPQPVAVPEPPAPEFAPVPLQLPRIAAKTAAEICKECEPEPAALKLLTPQQTPAQFLAILQERRLSADMVKVLAFGLGDREGLLWALHCIRKVAGKLPAADVRAVLAAEAWVKGPTPERQKAAAAAAEQTDFQGPGAWVAQGVAWAGAGAGKPRLTPQAVSAAVLLSSTILARPELASRSLQRLKAMALAAAAGHAAGMNVPQLSGASAQLQSLALGGAAVPNASIPQLPGAAGKIQTGLAALPSLGGMGASGAGLPAMGGAGIHGAVPGVSAVGVALAGAAALSAGAASALAGPVLPNVQLPGIPNPSLPSFSQPNVPQLTPEVQASVDLFMFREQQSFIAIGLEIASGRMPVA